VSRWNSYDFRADHRRKGEWRAMNKEVVERCDRGPSLVKQQQPRKTQPSDSVVAFTCANPGRFRNTYEMRSRRNRKLQRDNEITRPQRWLFGLNQLIHES
jgi:hypothetical protein